MSNNDIYYDEPYHGSIEYGAKDRVRLQFLIDTGANKNFISPQIAKGCTPLFKPFHVQSAAGKIEITHQLTGTFFSPIGNDFFRGSTPSMALLETIP